MLQFFIESLMFQDFWMMGILSWVMLIVILCVIYIVLMMILDRVLYEREDRIKYNSCEGRVVDKRWETKSNTTYVTTNSPGVMIPLNSTDTDYFLIVEGNGFPNKREKIEVDENTYDNKSLGDHVNVKYLETFKRLRFSDNKWVFEYYTLDIL